MLKSNKGNDNFIQRIFRHMRDPLGKEREDLQIVLFESRKRDGKQLIDAGGHVRRLSDEEIKEIQQKQELE